MIPYLIVFAVVIVLGSLSQNRIIKNKKVCLLILVVAAIILSLFGGLRSYNVGTDIGVYGQSYFEKAVHCNSFSKYAFNSSINTRGINDIGYLATNYMLSRFFSSPTALLITLQLLVNLPVFYLFYRRRKKISITFAILMYLCLWYGGTLNMLRQAVALSFMVLGLDYYLSGNRKKYAILTLIAILFHSTALYAVCIQLALLMLRKTSSKKRRTIELLLIICTAVIVVLLPTAISLLYAMGIIPNNLYSYVKSYSVSDIRLLNIDSLINIVIITPVLLSYFSKKRRDSNADVPEIYSIMGLITSFTKNIILYTDRFSFYFQFYNLVIVPEKLKAWKPKERKNKLAAYLLFIIALVVYCYIKHVIQGAHEIVPYASVL